MISLDMTAIDLRSLNKELISKFHEGELDRQQHDED